MLLFFMAIVYSSPSSSRELTENPHKNIIESVCDPRSERAAQEPVPLFNLSVRFTQNSMAVTVDFKKSQRQKIYETHFVSSKPVNDQTLLQKFDLKEIELSIEGVPCEMFAGTPIETAIEKISRDALTRRLSSQYVQSEIIKLEKTQKNLEAEVQRAQMKLHDPLDLDLEWYGLEEKIIGAEKELAKVRVEFDQAQRGLQVEKSKKPDGERTASHEEQSISELQRGVSTAESKLLLAEQDLASIEKNRSDRLERMKARAAYLAVVEIPLFKARTEFLAAVRESLGW